MIDGALRRVLDGPLTAVARAIDVRWVTPDRLTVAGLALGIASAATAAVHWWPAALLLWLVSRLLDGLDGSLARERTRRGRGTATGQSDAGGYLDIACDFVVYGSTVVGVGIGVTTQFDLPWWPFVAVLLAYYVNGCAFLAFSSIAQRTGRTIDDGRSFSFLGRIAEGTETIVVHSLWLAVPAIAWPIAIVWAVFVSISAVQRIVVGYRILR